MKKLVFLGACLVALASVPARAQTTEKPDVVVVRMSETGMGSRMVVLRPVGGPEEIDLPSSLVKSGEAIRQMVIKLYQEGYTLKGSVSVGIGTHATMIFTKEK